MKCGAFETDAQAAPKDVTALAIDGQGAMWIGTAAGLFHNDGTRTVAYSVRDGLPSELIGLLACDREGAMWIGTR